MFYVTYMDYMDYIGLPGTPYSRRDADVPLFSRLPLQIFLLFSPLLPFGPFNIHFA
jgi:hypothetical protein